MPPAQSNDWSATPIVGRVPTDPVRVARPRVLLGLGAVVGFVCAVTGLLAPEVRHRLLPANAVAAVNGELVRREDFERAVVALASDRRNPVDVEEKQHVLQRLVDEELLIQRALELGLARYDRQVRADLVAAMVHSVVSEAAGRDPSDGDVEAFYREHRDYFTQPGRVRLRQIFVATMGAGRMAEDAVVRAREAADRLRAGEPFAAVRRALGDAEVAPLPEGPLAPAKLQEYLGPTAVRAVLQLAPGEVSNPVRSAGGYSIFLLIDREVERIPPLDEIVSEVRAELRRRAGDRELRVYLDTLKERATIKVASVLP